MKRYIAEFIATFFLVLVGTAAIVADTQETVTRLQSTIGTLGIALAFGLALAVAIAAVGRISGGHANPAVSIAFYIAKRLSLKDPVAVVRVKGLGAGACTLLLALVTGQRFPTPTVLLAALVLGCVSYGVSIVLDTYALRYLGAA